MTNIPLIDVAWGGDGLYPNRSNQMPTSHALLGFNIMRSIVPLDFQGNPDPHGQIGFGPVTTMSNGKYEWQLFQQLFGQQHNLKEGTRFFNGGRGGYDMDACAFSRPAQYWDWFLNTYLANLKRPLSPLQIRVVTIKNSIRGLNLPLPDARLEVVRHLEKMVADIIHYLPNVEMIWVMSAMYSGFAMKPLPRCEPFAYYEGYGFKDFVEAHLDTRPWIAWGPYMWASGTFPRKTDNLIWERVDFRRDGVHPSLTGGTKWAKAMVDHFTKSELAAPWLVDTN